MILVIMTVDIIYNSNFIICLALNFGNQEDRIDDQHHLVV